MKIILIVIGLIILAVIIFVVYRNLVVNSQNAKLNAVRFERVKVLREKLESEQYLTEKDVLPFAQNLLTREMTYQLLSDYNKTELFPDEYFSIVKGAESELVNWLEFPTELGVCPDEIEHIKRVTFDFDGENHFVHYEVFKFKVNEPHQAATDGWLLGVVGPYFDESEPYDLASSTFSRFSPLDKITPEEEVKWVDEHITMKR